MFGGASSRPSPKGFFLPCSPTLANHQKQNSPCGEFFAIYIAGAAGAAGAAGGLEGRILKIPVPHTGQTPLRAGRVFPPLAGIWTSWVSFISRFSLHFT